jgi:hypothetical protein
MGISTTVLTSSKAINPIYVLAIALRDIREDNTVPNGAYHYDRYCCSQPVPLHLRREIPQTERYIGKTPELSQSFAVCGKPGGNASCSRHFRCLWRKSTPCESSDRALHHPGAQSFVKLRKPGCVVTSWYISRPSRMLLIYSLPVH